MFFAKKIKSLNDSTIRFAGRKKGTTIVSTNLKLKILG